MSNNKLVFPKVKDSFNKFKEYVCNNNFWSEATFYRRINNLDSLQEREAKVLIDGYNIHIVEPLNTTIMNVQQLLKTA